MKTIKELTRDTQILCDSDEQRTAVFALCEQAGLRLWGKIIAKFKSNPNVYVFPNDGVYFENNNVETEFPNIPATEFLTDKKAEI